MRGMGGPGPGISAAMDDVLPILESLDELADLVDKPPVDGELFLRWSQGPDVDLAGAGGRSRDSLTGVPLPGLSANPLRVEPWWGDRSRRLWAARRLYDYGHLHKAEARPWVLVGDPAGHGPDNEPLVRRARPVAWVAEKVFDEARELVEQQPATSWGPLDRDGA
jgi:hypothetical protein